MPTVGERLAAMEVELRETREDVRALVSMIGDRGQPDSVRGRLHRLEGDVAAAIMLRQASIRLISRGWRYTAGVALIATAAAPYVIFFLSR